MKKIIYLFAALPILVLTACSDDDDSTPEGINGRWYLVKTDTPWVAAVNEFDRGDIKWTFDGNNTVVVVKDVILPQDAGTISGPPSGTYDYSIAPWEMMCDEALTIDDTNYGCITFDGDTLRISASPVDGPIYSLVR